MKKTTNSDDELINGLQIPLESKAFLKSAFEYLRKFELQERALSIACQREKIFGYAVALYQCDLISLLEYSRLCDAKDRFTGGN